MTDDFEKVSFRIGQIIGQPLGGLLSHPARTMPFFDSPFWREYPFSLPCFAASIFAFSATVLAIVALPEVRCQQIRQYKLLMLVCRHYKRGMIFVG